MGAQAFVYYKIDPEDEARVRAQLRLLQAELAERLPGLEVELLTRADPDAEGRRTLMEIYRRPGRGVDADCRAAIAAVVPHRLSPFLRGPRHIEVFDGDD